MFFCGCIKSDVFTAINLYIVVFGAVTSCYVAGGFSSASENIFRGCIKNYVGLYYKARDKFLLRGVSYIVQYSFTLNM